ncbi:MAG: BatA domain-containing protein, partial [Flavobacteriales bacterium]|nr:BatA domain-containing protein [Flavobacteriales bacterium]
PLSSHPMSFLHPAFLWALTALAIPVLIHLFQLRRFKRIDFTNVRLLAEVSQQTRARKRCSIGWCCWPASWPLAQLGGGHSRNHLPQADSAVRPGQRAVSIHIDDSLQVWTVTNPEGRLPDQARKGKGAGAVMGYSATDRFRY